MNQLKASGSLFSFQFFIPSKKKAICTESLSPSAQCQRFGFLCSRRRVVPTWFLLGSSGCFQCLILGYNQKKELCTKPVFVLFCKSSCFWIFSKLLLFSAFRVTFPKELCFECLSHFFGCLLLILESSCLCCCLKAFHNYMPSPCL